MHRFIVKGLPASAAGQVVELPREEAQHAVKVLRLRPGDRVELIDGEGRVYAAEMTQAGRDGAAAVVLTELPGRESPVRLTLYMGLPKAEKLELIRLLQKLSGPAAPAAFGEEVAGDRQD